MRDAFIVRSGRPLCRGRSAQCVVQSRSLPGPLFFNLAVSAQSPGPGNVGIHWFLAAAHAPDTSNAVIGLIDRRSERWPGDAGATGCGVLERPKVHAHGDLACNVALADTKPLKKNPREIALSIAEALKASSRKGTARRRGGSRSRIHQPAAGCVGKQTVVTSGAYAA